MSAPLHPASRLRRASDVVARDIAGEHLLVPVRSGLARMNYLYIAGEVGSFLYARLDGRRDLRDLARSVAEAFEVEPEAALRDAGEFLRELVDEGLAIVEEGS